MKYRCPYCRHTLGSEPVATCPRCRKTMKIPAALRADERKKARRSVATRRLGDVPLDMPLPEFLGRRKPSHLLMILGVMALLGGMLAVKSRTAFKPRTAKTPQAVARRELDVLCSALELFRDDCSRYPATEEGLFALINNPGVSSWKGPYVTLIRPDPWKTRYVYRNENERITLFSPGPDRTEKTPDDILPTVPVP